MLRFNFIKAEHYGGQTRLLVEEKKNPHVPHPMLRFKNFKTENSGRGTKTYFVHPGMLEGGKAFRGGKKTPLPEKGREGKGREGEGRGVTFLTQIDSIARN